MSHDANTVFITPGNPPTGITAGDIASVLGRSGADLGQLCSDKVWNNGSLVDAGRIRMWAKKKPVRYDKWGIINDAERKSVNHGLTTTVATATGTPTNSSSFFYKLLAGTLPWSYLPPRGLSYNEQFRYRDFEGYDNRATTPPAYPFSLTSVMLAYDGSLQIAFDYKRCEDYELSLFDLRMDGVDINDWYFGVLLYYASNSYAFAAPATVENGNLSVTFSNMNGWAGRKVKVVPFLSTVQLQRDTARSGGKYISFLGFEPVDVAIVANSSGVYSQFDSLEWNENNNAVSYAITINNTTAQTKSGLTVYIELWEGSDDPTQGQSVASRTISYYSIQGNTTDSTTCVGTFSNITRTPGAQYFVAISSLNDNVIQRHAEAVEDYLPRI